MGKTDKFGMLQTHTLFLPTQCLKVANERLLPDSAAWRVEDVPLPEPTHSQTSVVRGSLPIYGEDLLSCSEFIKKYHLASHFEGRLDALEFQPRKRVAQVSEAVIAQAGFTEMSWLRVHKANNEYCAEIGREKKTFGH